MEKLDDASRFAWACSVFGLQPGASQEAIRAAVMAQLESADFMPPVAWRQAIWLLCDSRAPQAWPQTGYDAFRDTAESSLAEEVDAFATRFFILPPGTRREQWTQLMERAEPFPRLQARLSSWQRGLDAETVAAAQPGQLDAVLAERLCRLFVLKPSAQEAQRRHWLASMIGDWRPVVRQLRAKCPRLAQLDADFLSALASETRETAAARIAAEPLAGPRAPARLPTSKPALYRQSASVSSGSSSGSYSRGSGVLVAVVLVTVIRMIAQSSNWQPSPSYQVPPNYPPYHASPSQPPTYGPNFNTAPISPQNGSDFEDLRENLNKQFNAKYPAAEKEGISPPDREAHADSPFPLRSNGAVSSGTATGRGPP